MNQRFRHLGLTSLATAIVAGLPLAASAVGQGDYRMELLINGQSLTEHHARNSTYVEAVKGAEYAVRLTNNTVRRVAVALSVDGLNSIDAKTGTAASAAKWILDPRQTVTISGWQVDSDHARRFFFTTEEDSYGAWLGRTTNLGAVEAVFFREKHKPVPLYKRREMGSDSAAGEGSARPAPLPDSPERKTQRPETEADDLAATGIGRKIDHGVRRVRFEAEPKASAHLRVRYEYHPQLVRLGVLPPLDDDLRRREQARGFTDMEFAPDPWAAR